MPGKHTAREKRQARHVYDSERRGGAPVASAKRVAWATVNKRRNPPLNPELELAIRDGMARCLWVSAVADYTEEHGENAAVPNWDEYGRGGPRKDWDDIVADTPMAAMHAANDLCTLYAANEKIADVDGVMSTLFEQAAQIDTGEPLQHETGAPYRVTWGVYRDKRGTHPPVRTGYGSREEAERKAASVKGEKVRVAEDDPGVVGTPTVGDVARSFGWDMAAEALGTGIAWSDDHTTKRKGPVTEAVFDPKTPSFECHFDGEDLSWSGRGEASDIRSGHEATRTPKVTCLVSEIVNDDDEGGDIEVEGGRFTSEETMWPTDAQRELGWTIVDKAVQFIHTAATQGDNDLEPNFHGSPHTLAQGPARDLYWMTYDELTDDHSATRHQRVYRLEGFTWLEQTQVFERIYREEWEPRPTQIGRITVVNPTDGALGDACYVLQFSTGGIATPRTLMAYADSEDESFDLCIDWLEEQGLEGYFEDEQVRDDEDLAENMITGGNHTHYIDPQNFAIVARQPSINELRDLGREP